MTGFVMALDQGTTSSRAILFGRDGSMAAVAQQEFPQIYPSPGHVEHDPEAIWQSQIETAKRAQAAIGAEPGAIAAIGITNQRETVVVWDKTTGKPVQNAIVWQSRITVPICEAMKRDGFEPTVREKTGLVIDAYFSGTKLTHLLDTIPSLRDRAEAGDILCGTIDTFLLWRMTGGAVHATDFSNASRTMLFNIHTLDWDPELLAMMRVPRAMLPQVRDSSGVFGETTPDLFGRKIPIAGIAGDQQAATFGQACFLPGMAKNTYGTGCFLLKNIGCKPVASAHGLLTTIGWGIGGNITYCLEGSVFIAGAAVQWLRDGLGLIRASAEIETVARSVPDAGGVVFVPAFVGLGTPYWDPTARGTIVGITGGTQAGHLAHATLDAMAFQTRAVVDAMEADSGMPLAELRVDGGAAVNNPLMQFQADILGKPVQRPAVTETTALGAAYLAGLAVGFWPDTNEVIANRTVDRTFTPTMPEVERTRRYGEWKRAVERARNWTTTD